jgi:hypothetical protein
MPKVEIDNAKRNLNKGRVQITIGEVATIYSSE